MRTYLLILVFVTACLIPSVLIMSGHVRTHEPALQVAAAEPQPAVDVRIPQNEQQDVNQPAQEFQPNDATQEAQNPLVRGVRQLLHSTFNSSEVEDERNQLEQSLIDADSLLTKAKRQNRDALRQANRQVRVRGPQSPNVVLIVVSGLRPSDLGCYGESAAHTSHIDRLAEKGMRFTNFSAGSRNSAASRWSLLTGLQVERSGQKSEDTVALRSEEITLAESMWQGGYATGVVGLWGVPTDSVEPIPNDHGFDEWLGFRNVDEAKVEFPQQVSSDRGRMKIVANADGRQSLAAVDLFTQEGISFIERRQAERPFFLLLSFPEPTSERQTRIDAVKKIDQQVGRICERLRNLEIDEETVVLVTSDNGSPRVEVADGASLANQTPLIINWTGIATGSVIDRPCSMCDLYPTLADIVALHRRPTWTDGVSLYSQIIREHEARNNE